MVKLSVVGSLSAGGLRRSWGICILVGREVRRASLQREMRDCCNQGGGISAFLVCECNIDRSPRYGHESPGRRRPPEGFASPWRARPVACCSWRIGSAESLRSSRWTGAAAALHPARPQTRSHAHRTTEALNPDLARSIIDASQRGPARAHAQGSGSGPDARHHGRPRARSERTVTVDFLGAPARF
jgi:hypothetical protein